MGATAKGFPYPELSDSPDVPRDIRALAEAADALAVKVDALPKIFYGTGAPPTTGFKTGDVYLKHA